MKLIKPYKMIKKRQQCLLQRTSGPQRSCYSVAGIPVSRHKEMVATKRHRKYRINQKGYISSDCNVDKTKGDHPGSWKRFQKELDDIRYCYLDHNNQLSMLECPSCNPNDSVKY